MYSGFLIKFGNYTFPLSLIESKSFKVSKKVMDLDAERTADGVLHREALDHTVLKVNFTLVNGITDSVLSPILAHIQSNYSIPLERKVSVSVYVPEEGKYETQDMYFADPEITIRKISEDDIVYDSVSFSLTGY